MINDYKNDYENECKDYYKNNNKKTENITFDKIFINNICSFNFKKGNIYYNNKKLAKIEKSKITNIDYLKNNKKNM